MFENLEESKNDQNNQQPSAATQAAAPQFPPQGKVEDIFSGVKEAGIPKTNSGQGIPEPLKVANKTKGGGLVLKLLIAIIVVLILAIAGLVVASQFFGFTGIKDLISGSTTNDVVVPKKTQPIATPEDKPTTEVKDDNKATAIPENIEKNSGMPEDNTMPSVTTEKATSSEVMNGDNPISTTTQENSVDNNDTDGDMLTDKQEVDLGTDPAKPDTDGDGLTDGEEVNAFKTSPLKVDTDNDELSDYDEVKKYLTDPNKADTDADGYLDGKEVQSGYNPKGPGKLVQTN